LRARERVSEEGRKGAIPQEAGPGENEMEKAGLTSCPLFEWSLNSVRVSPA